MAVEQEEIMLLGEEEEVAGDEVGVVVVAGVRVEEVEVVEAAAEDEAVNRQAGEP